MKRNFSITAVFFVGLLTGILLITLMGFGENDVHSNKQAPMYNDPVKWKAPELPEQISFAGEVVPLQNREVKEQLERELIINYYMPGNILYMMKLANRYFPGIERQLKENNLPDDFKYLCVAESNLMNAISRSGATGFWQFMKGTAPGYSLEISETVDERYHVEKSTKAACVYLLSAYKRFGNWTAAAASYNCGMGAYADRAGYQKTTNYYELILPEETQRYIFRILAFKFLLTNADSLGFFLPEAERYQPVETKTLAVRSAIPDLAAFAEANGTDYKMLKWLNPWLRARSLKVKHGKIYELQLPLK